VVVPRGVEEGDGSSVVAAGCGEGLDVEGAWMEIVVSDAAGVCERLGATEGEGVASGAGVWLEGVGVITGAGVTTAGVELGVPSVIDPSTVVCPSVDAGLATTLLPNT
jgi:hypothetical protein